MRSGRQCETIRRVAAGRGPFTAPQLYEWLWAADVPKTAIPVRSGIRRLLEIAGARIIGKEHGLVIYEIPAEGSA